MVKCGTGFAKRDLDDYLENLAMNVFANKTMQTKVLNAIVTAAIIWTMIAVPLAQNKLPEVSIRQSKVSLDVKDLLHDMAESTPQVNKETFENETGKIIDILKSPAKLCPIIIDQTGADRQLIVSLAAARLPETKKIVSIDWNALLSDTDGREDASRKFGVIVADFRSQLKVCAQERGTQLGDQLLAGITFVAPRLAAEIALQAAVVLGPVRRLVREC
jgi:hypothetical protein